MERKGKGTGRKKKKQGKAVDDDGSAALPFEMEDNVRKNEAVKVAVEGREGKENPLNNNVKKKKKGKPKRDKSGALVEEGEALFQGFRVTREDKERLEKLERKLKQGGVKG